MIVKYNEENANNEDNTNDERRKDMIITYLKT